MIRDVLVSERISNFFQRAPLRSRISQQRAHRISNLMTPAVANRDVDAQAIHIFRRVLGAAQLIGKILAEQ